MPGTGHSARYKGSISNRSKISPFEHLAKWNQQLLGADGAVPSIVGGNSLEFKKLDATNIAGVMHNPAIADLNMNNFRITNVTNISNGGGAMQLSSSGNLFITSASEVQIQPSSGANIVLECASTGQAGDIILRWPDAGQSHNIKIGNNNTLNGNKSVLIMADQFSTGVNNLIMGSGSLTLANLVALTTTISGQNTMAISGPNITIGGGATATNLIIGNTTGATVTTIRGGGAGGGAGDINLGNTLAETVSIGHSAGELGFFGKTPIVRPQCNLLNSISEGPTGVNASIEQIINRINYIIRIMDEGGGGGSVPDGLGLWKNGGGVYNDNSGS